MSSTLLVINTVLFLSFGPFRGASNLIRDTVLLEKENAQDLNGINSYNQIFTPCQDRLIKRSGKSIRNDLKENPAATNLCDTDAHFKVDHHHQIHKRNLNRDFPMKRMVNNGRQLNSSPFISKPDIFDKKISTSDQKDILRDFVDNIVLNDKINLDDTGSFGKFGNGGLQTLNDTTKISSKDNFILNDNNKNLKELKKYAADDSNVNSYSNDDVYFINNKNDNDNTIDVFSIDGLINDTPVKREASEAIANSSNNTFAIKAEIDKVYKDISDNVRLLSKLRDKESLLLKRPSNNNKRWVIVDNTINDKQRKKKCTQELTVEMDTNRDATPDRLEHIERKIEEEVLQVNVPLKCKTCK